MPPEPLLDMTGVDLTRFEHDLEAIRRFNPHRFEFEQLDGIVRFWADPLAAVARRRLREDEFWTRGHFPGNPVFPGVLMVEAGAQAASFCFHMKFGRLEGKVFGFGGLEDVRFRGAVRPGDDIVIQVREHAVRMRRAVFDMHAYVEDRLVCEGRIIGVTMPVPSAV